MQFIKPGININFIGRRKIAFVISLVMFVLAGMTNATSGVMAKPFILFLLMVFFFLTSLFTGALYVQGSNREMLE